MIFRVSIGQTLVHCHCQQEEKILEEKDFKARIKEIRARLGVDGVQHSRHYAVN